MRLLARAILAIAASTSLSALAPVCAQAKVVIAVDLDHQTIHVEGKDQTYDWKVSSGKPGYDTPTGTAGVLWMDKDHHSDEYDQAPMPNAIFFAPGYAIHGAYSSAWGHRASHGCVRIPVAKSAILFDMVKAEGGAQVTITGSSPETIADVRAKARETAANAATADAYPADATQAGAVPQYDDQGYDRPSRARAGDGLFGSVY